MTSLVPCYLLFALSVQMAGVNWLLRRYMKRVEPEDAGYRWTMAALMIAPMLMLGASALAFASFQQANP